ncbi:Transcriptional regulator HilA [Bradyrhizobium ivorense]|uniref:Transcriptional regulator HilA n=1 Tax=Bradyrhizobium ivorense TaxID=2511166 RepID=A0A508SUY1_9BRAD|nr:winged helix-turn-helix domain-containing tetratricopeptide repeat protein [Bradyrhizobium ivorense]VIO65880.1 Transcriptional regulator HilA [Bradyrhizobium ivorense]
MRYLFDDFILDTDRRELRRGADLVPTPPQVFDLLDYLIGNRDRVVSKDDLISAVWNGRIVSDAALATRLNAARAAVGDAGDKQRLIKTMQRKGFRFVGTVQEVKTSTDQPVGTAAHGGDLTPSSSSPRLSIVALPFANLSSDPTQDYFVDGVTESLTTDLSRIRGSFVIGRHTAFTYKGKQVDLKQIGRELNVRYVLEGSVQRSGKRLRVNVQLISAETGNHLWAERFDKPLADLFDLQDEIVSRLANTLEAQLIEAEARRAESTLHPDALDLYFLGGATANKAQTLENLMQARSFFERALALEPAHVEALVGTALVDLSIAGLFLTDDRTGRFAAAEAASTKALSLAPDFAAAHFALGAIYIATNRAADGIAECEQALALNQNLADAHAAIGWAKFLLGHGAETEAHVNEALRQSPRDISSFRWMAFVGLAKAQVGADAEAVTWLRRSIDANRNVPLTHFNLAATLALLGRFEEARTAAQTGLALDPSFTIRRYQRNLSSDNPTFLAKRERVYEGMRLAGVPEG